MTTPEGITTLTTVPRLRRLLDEAEKAKADYETRIRTLAGKDDINSERALNSLYSRLNAADSKLRRVAIRALPALLDAAERMAKLERALREIRMCSDDERVLRLARIALKAGPS